MGNQSEECGEWEILTRIPGAAGAADAVHVVLGVFGDAVVDHVGDAGDVDAACGDVGGDDDGDARPLLNWLMM